MTDTAHEFAPANPVLGHALAYYAERRTMNNPKGWDHVLQVVNHAIEAGQVHASQAQVDEARRTLHALVANETATSVREHEWWCPECSTACDAYPEFSHEKNCSMTQVIERSRTTTSTPWLTLAHYRDPEAAKTTPTRNRS